MSLYETSRPATFDAVVGQERAVKVRSRLSLGGRAFWITGSSGTGKTTLARIIAGQVAEGWSTPAECLYTEETAEAIEAT